MYSISVAFGNLPTPWRFLFREKEKAEQYRDFTQNFPTQDLVITDDFGQHAKIRGGSIHAIMVEDLNETQQAAIEMMLHDTRARLKAQQQAKTDPMIKAASMTQQSPMIVPGGLNGPRLG